MANFTALKTAINNAIKTNGNEEITGAILQAILDAMVETLGDSAITDLENAITTEVTNRENAVGGVADDLAAEVQARQALDYNVNNRINAEEYNRQNADAALSQTMSQGFQTLGSQMTALNAAISALNAAYQNGYLYGGIATPSSSPSNNKCFYIALQGGTYTNFGGVGVVEGINIIKNDSGWKVEHIYDQTTLLNEFYLLRQQVIRALASYEPIVVYGDVTNAPDEEDLTSNAQHLLKFKDRDYSPQNFSGLGMKILRKNILPLNDSVAFNGFLEGVTAEETLAGSPELIFWDRMNTRFVGIKDGIYYAAWTDDDNYVPVSTSLVYMYNGTPYQWTGSDFIVDETEVPNLVNCLTQDMLNEANTIYIIRYDYTLKENITIPANCVLQFDGGSLYGGSLIFNNTILSGEPKFLDINNLGGIIQNSVIYARWFGIIGTTVQDRTRITANDKGFEMISQIFKGKEIRIDAGFYRVSKTIKMQGGYAHLKGSGMTQGGSESFFGTIICANDDFVGDYILDMYEEDEPTTSNCFSNNIDDIAFHCTERTGGIKMGAYDASHINNVNVIFVGENKIGLFVGGRKIYNSFGNVPSVTQTQFASSVNIWSYSKNAIGTYLLTNRELVFDNFKSMISGDGGIGIIIETSQGLLFNGCSFQGNIAVKCIESDHITFETPTLEGSIIPFKFEGRSVRIFDATGLPSVSKGTLVTQESGYRGYVYNSTSSILYLYSETPDIEFDITSPIIIDGIEYNLGSNAYIGYKGNCSDVYFLRTRWFGNPSATNDVTTIVDKLINSRLEASDGTAGSIGHRFFTISNNCDNVVLVSKHIDGVTNNSNSCVFKYKDSIIIDADNRNATNSEDYNYHRIIVKNCTNYNISGISIDGINATTIDVYGTLVLEMVGYKHYRVLSYIGTIINHSNYTLIMASKRFKTISSSEDFYIGGDFGDAEINCIEGSAPYTANIRCFNISYGTIINQKIKITNISGNNTVRALFQNGVVVYYNGLIYTGSGDPKITLREETSIELVHIGVNSYEIKLIRGYALFQDFTNSAAVPIATADKGIIQRGNASTITPNDKSQGLNLWDIKTNQPVFWDGYNWDAAILIRYNAKRKGTWSEKPSNMPTGIAYICTSGASIDGGTTEKTNLPIFYTGSGWVDGSGNAVVAKS